jgi:uncharacterized membrane protein YdjX (TVP38/TMEM64 family)
MHILVAIAYCKVYDSYWKRFLMTTWIIFVGIMLGALIVIYLSRYLIADWIKKQIRKSKSDWAKNFNAIDSIFKTDGIFSLALLSFTIVPTFGINSYILGVICVSLLDYTIGTSFFIIEIILCVTMRCSIWQAT